MDYLYQNAHGQAPPEQLYYDQQGFGQIPISYIDASLISDSCTPVDPSLESYSQVQFQVTWPGHQTHQLQQYMEGPRTSFFIPDQVHTAQNISYSAQTSNPLPPASQRRHGSPCSQQTLSSSDSHSPPTESDILPATPPDYSATSPFMQHKQYSVDWEAQQQYRTHTLLGMGMQGSACVNPHEVNLSQAMFDDDVISTNLNPSRTFSFCTESDDLSIAQHTGAYPSRQITPEPIIKSEIHVAEQPFGPVYPDPEPSEQEPSESAIKAEVSSFNDGEKALDFAPKTSRKRTRNPTVKSLSSSTPERKRPRVNSNDNGQTPNFTAPVPSSRRTKITCTECKTSFSDESTYQKHMKQHHTRPFVCVFNYAGCPSTFASKNEWKRHVSSQHLALQYWLCTQDGCSKTTNPPTSRRSSSSSPISPTPPALPNGAIFNRKDLYTQHVRRMHVPHNVRKAQKQKKPTPDWDELLKSLQTEAEKTRCDLPRHMRCPAVNCSHEFNGPQAWDERMEHVARHLERAADGKEPPVVFGGEVDPTLSNWASSAEVYVVRRTNTAQGWELINPLKGEVGPSSGNGKPGSGSGSVLPSSSPLKEIVVAGYSDEDAEGEDEE
ncbi:C2H2 finger domain-containing protein [Colletotrichum truncatum]|uniref:C2H2 finger domain-containing protein n=1 Tax=Colletotrichum truncatum TaxID=5467 RepID=A0ACC3ZEM1_COLTU|nr:C2H2 finger domain-containing protein [Colletotrichum truncatum]KAF6801400.1 C2H2 finger domain-containing protein [Colletotrichum truncatum]